jgi:hypothetical protein
LPCCFDNRQLLRFDIDQLAANSLTGDWVGTSDKPAQGSDSAANWAGAVHGCDCIDNGQGRVYKFEYLDQKFAKILELSAFSKMPQGLLLTADTAKHIFDRKGCHQLLMRFELG